MQQQACKHEEGTTEFRVARLDTWWPEDRMLLDVRAERGKESIQDKLPSHNTELEELVSNPGAGKKSPFMFILYHGRSYL